jgi:hypothetical protein
MDGQKNCMEIRTSLEEVRTKTLPTREIERTLGCFGKSLRRKDSPLDFKLARI